MAFGHEVAGQLVIGRKGAFIALFELISGTKRREVPLGAALTQQDVHAEAQFLLRFGQLGGFVVGLDAGQDVGVQVAAPQTGGVAVDVLALARLDLGQLALRAQIDAG